tara:strand:+ start:263 stop:1129 length:867 start_codon:yes stop_codon:yes gene_type:complete
MLEHLKNKKFTGWLEKNKDQATVLLSGIVLLEFYLKDQKIIPYSKTTIEHAFNKQHKKFGINTFRRDYIKRQSGVTSNLIDENDEKFFIKEDFLTDGLKALRKAVDELYSYYSKKNEVIKKFMSKISNSIESEDYSAAEKILFDMLLHGKHYGKRGQSFEISCFAILKQYFHSFGYELRRFSVTVANDGGMDFVGQSAIFQVTELMNDKKFDEDIDKCPNTPRIIVYHRISKSFDKRKFKHPLILRHLSVEDINCFYSDLKQNCKTSILEIMKTISHEYSREIIFADK